MSVAYGLLPAEDRPRLHRLAAEVVENSPFYGEGQDHAVIARHLELAGDRDSSAKRYIEAARHAVEIGGNADGLRLLERALKLLPQDAHEDRYAVYSDRERMSTFLGRRAEREDAIAAMHTAAEALGDPDKLAHTFLREADFHIDGRNPYLAARAIDEASTHARAADNALTQADALRLRATVARTTGDTELSLALCEEALPLCDSSRRGMNIRALVVNCRGGALWSQGRLDASIEAFAESLLIYRHLEMPRKEADSLNNMGIIFFAMGEIEQALAHYKRSLEINSRMGDRPGVAARLSNIGQAYAAIGDANRAELYLRKAMKLAEQIDDTAAIIDVIISIGHVHLGRRQLERGRAALSRGLKLARIHRERYQEIRALALSSMVQLADGAWDNALDLARCAAITAEKMVMPVGQIYGVTVQAMALARMGRMSEAIEASTAAVNLLMDQVRPENAEEILYYHAVVCERAGDMATASRAITASYRELADKMGRLHDPELAESYRASHIPQAIIATHERLIGSVPS